LGDNDLQAFCAKVALALQVFGVWVRCNTVLVGQQGTRLLVPKQTFDVPAGSGPVELRLREFYSTADIVLAGLGTRTGLDLLETGGMLHLEAATGGRGVSLRPGVEITIQLPTKQLPGMQL
jgi:hypothetical protein